MFDPVKRINLWEDTQYSSKRTDREEIGESKRARIEYQRAGDEQRAATGSGAASGSGSQPANDTAGQIDPRQLKKFTTSAKKLVNTVNTVRQDFVGA